MNQMDEPGVSPAYSISCFGLDFSVDDAISHLEEIVSLGYGGVQAEAPRGRYVTEWVDGGARRFGQRAVEVNLEVRQFVAHFVFEQQGAPLWMVDAELSPVADLAHAATALPGCTVVTIPLGADPSDDDVAPAGRDKTTAAQRLQHLRDYATRLIRTFPDSMNLAFEPTPGSLLSTAENATRFFDGMETPRVGVVLDTGNLWSGGTDPAAFARAVGPRRLFGTHLCDNDGTTSESRRPGAGTIDWPALFTTLTEIGYTGPFDVEIRSAVSDVETEYRNARTYIRELLQPHMDTTQGGS